MSQSIHPLYGAIITDAWAAKAVPLPAGLYEGMEPSISGSGPWTLTIQPGTWRTAWDTAHGHMTVMEDTAFTVTIAAASAQPRIDIVVGAHKWVQGAINAGTGQPDGLLSENQKAIYAVVQGTPGASPSEPTISNPFDGSNRIAVPLFRVLVPTSGTPTVIRYPASDLRLDDIRSKLGSHSHDLDTLTGAFSATGAAIKDNTGTTFHLKVVNGVLALE